MPEKILNYSNLENLSLILRFWYLDSFKAFEYSAFLIIASYFWCNTVPSETCQSNLEAISDANSFKPAAFALITSESFVAG